MANFCSNCKKLTFEDRRNEDAAYAACSSQERSRSLIHKGDAVAAGKPAGSPVPGLAGGVGGAGCNRSDRMAAVVHTYEADNSRGGDGCRAVREVEAYLRGLVGPCPHGSAFHFVQRRACDTPFAAA